MLEWTRLRGSRARIMIKTEDYLDVFARFKRKENVGSVEKILAEAPLERFERSQLGNRVPDPALIHGAGMVTLAPRLDR